MGRIANHGIGQPNEGGAFETRSAMGRRAASTSTSPLCEGGVESAQPIRRRPPMLERRQSHVVQTEDRNQPPESIDQLPGWPLGPPLECRQSGSRSSAGGKGTGVTTVIRGLATLALVAVLGVSPAFGAPTDGEGEPVHIVTRLPSVVGGLPASPHVPPEQARAWQFVHLTMP